MELLLNLTWLLLALPAYWLWRRSFHTRALGKLGSLQCLLALACLLVLLFPVISATDDLHAMRQEAEESSSSAKQTLKQANAPGARDFNAPALISAVLQAPPCTETYRQVLLL